MLRFSLRSLLLLISVVACWLGWEANIVRARRAALLETSSSLEARFVFIDEVDLFSRPIDVKLPARLSWIRRVMGDRQVYSIGIPTERWRGSAEARNGLQSQFPEAQLHELAPRIYEPCHPGCFPAGTLVETPGGPQPIESLAVGDLVFSFAPDGSRSAMPIQALFRTRNKLWELETHAARLITTETQPFCLASGKFRSASELHPGDELLYWRDGRLCPAAFLGAKPSGREDRVFNLVLGDQKTFLANQFLVRGKPPRAE